MNARRSAALLVLVLTGSSSVASVAPSPVDAAVSPRREVIAVTGERDAGTWRLATSASQTIVTRVEKDGSWSTIVKGPHTLPAVTALGLKGGPSFDGSAVVVVPVAAGAPTSSSFRVVTKSGVRSVDLPGRWEFDAISPNGAVLYLTEWVSDATYWVRAVNVQSGRAEPRVATKTIAAAPTLGGLSEGAMSGLPIYRVVGRGGSPVYTLYEGPTHPFVHMLDVVSGAAVCFELPDDWRADARALRLRLGKPADTVDVVRGNAVAAQITGLRSSVGPSVRLPGSSQPPLVP